MGDCATRDYSIRTRRLWHTVLAKELRPPTPVKIPILYQPVRPEISLLRMATVRQLALEGFVACQRHFFPLTLQTCSYSLALPYSFRDV